MIPHEDLCVLPGMPPHRERSVTAVPNSSWGLPRHPGPPPSPLCLGTRRALNGAYSGTVLPFAPIVQSQGVSSTRPQREVAGVQDPHCPHFGLPTRPGWRASSAPPPPRCPREDARPFSLLAPAVGGSGEQGPGQDAPGISLGVLCGHGLRPPPHGSPAEPLRAAACEHRLMPAARPLQPTKPGLTLPQGSPPGAPGSPGLRGGPPGKSIRICVSSVPRADVTQNSKIRTAGPKGEWTLAGPFWGFPGFTDSVLEASHRRGLAMHLPKAFPKYEFTKCLRTS